MQRAHPRCDEPGPVPPGPRSLPTHPWVARALVVGLLLALPALDVRPAFAGWGARKSDPKPAAKPRKPRKPRKPGSSSAARRPAAARVASDAPLADRVQAALSRNASAKSLLPLIKEAVARREMALALQMAEAVRGDRRAGPDVLCDVAGALGTGHPFPVQLAIWARAYARPGRSPWLRDSIEEGYADALLASREHVRAGEVLFAALKRRRAGTRGPIVERLVAWARVADAMDQVREKLLALRDPDAAIAAAKLVAELDGDEVGLAVLRDAFKQFPGHRGLAHAYVQQLSRLGAREELEAAVAKMVRVNGGDPMPWLIVLDAHIVARDRKAARALIDTLATRHARHDVLIEALIDREQRLGDDFRRIEPLFQALLRAAPRNPAYVEAYAEYLLVRSHGRLDRALAVLARLEKMPGGKVAGRRRIAALLAAHGHNAEARSILLELRDAAPDQREIRRDLAQLDAASGRHRDAEATFRELAQIPPRSDAALRRDIAEARRGLIALLRRQGELVAALRRLRDDVSSGRSKLGDALVLLDGAVAEAESGGDAVLPAEWALELAAEPPTGPLQPFADDAEFVGRVGVLLVLGRQFDPALVLAERLMGSDGEQARELALRIDERALARRSLAAAARAEALLERSGLDATTCIRLGEMHLRAGDPVGARRLLQRAAALAPRDTRPTARLARLFRDQGERDAEDAALRAVVVRATDADELDAAGKRLLTLAMARGQASDLLRWLDAIMPTHPRRAILERFRLQAYDAWLRTASLERRLSGTPQADPGSSALSDALAQGDLAMRVRALRQAARQRRPIPPALARRLLGDSNAIIRRDTVFALAAAGDDGSIAVLLEMEGERDLSVATAQLLALGRLPPTPRAVPYLETRMDERNTASASLAALVLGHVADPAAVDPLMRAYERSAHLRLPLILAMGAVARNVIDGPKRARMVAAIVAGSHTDPTLDAGLAATQRIAAAWALAASNDPTARAMLEDLAVTEDQRLVRTAAVLLLAAESPPTLDSAAFEVDGGDTPAGAQHVHTDVMTALFAPWLVPTPAELRSAMQRLDETFGARLESLPEDRREAFCDHLGHAALAGGRVAALCP
ncbi:MAG: hypothetical protein H6747_02215 [Deltaproteobacteria bacterium]|nr:hypothetical protein [Deltaproteobacteria bacterium]